MSILDTSTLSINWVKKYIELAKHISSWSKDPNSKIGAVAVGGKGQILSQGYNGFPRGIEDQENRLIQRDIKYRYVVHAEQNCIYNATLNGVSLNNSDLYVYGLPVCSECAKGVIQVGVKRVFMCYPEEVSIKWRDSMAQSIEMFNEAGVLWHLFPESLSSESTPAQRS
jgi:dCMP deaminase